LKQINEDARNYLETTNLRPRRVDFRAYFANEIQSPLGFDSHIYLTIRVLF